MLKILAEVEFAILWGQSFWARATTDGQPLFETQRIRIEDFGSQKNMQKHHPLSWPGFPLGQQKLVSFCWSKKMSESPAVLKKSNHRTSKKTTMLIVSNRKAIDVHVWMSGTYTSLSSNKRPPWKTTIQSAICCGFKNPVSISVNNMIPNLSPHRLSKSPYFCCYTKDIPISIPQLVMEFHPADVAHSFWMHKKIIAAMP